MIRWGAIVSEPERPQLVAYLARHFAPAPVAAHTTAAAGEAVFKRACLSCHGANLDDGGMWPIAFALTELTSADEAKIGRARGRLRERAEREGGAGALEHFEAADGRRSPDVDTLVASLSAISLIAS